MAYSNVVHKKEIGWFVVILTGILEGCIIVYNHFTGKIMHNDLISIGISFIVGWVFAAVMGLLLVFSDLQLIYFMNKHFPWTGHLSKRAVLEVVFCVGFSVIAGSLISLLSHLLFPYHDGLWLNLINNILITTVVNLLVLSILEAWIYYKSYKESHRQSELLEKELSTIRFEVLKNQINPHFMFNSLSVLSGLIRSNPTLAQTFITDFASVYRYVLECIDKPIVYLKEELDFAQAYMHLQTIRYGNEALFYSVDIDAESLYDGLPPLSLQTVLENALKHNLVQKECPLRIHLWVENACLCVRNNLQVKQSNPISTKIGLNNLSKRYRIIHDIFPQFFIKDSMYIAKLPLIKIEK